MKIILFEILSIDVTAIAKFQLDWMRIYQKIKLLIFMLMNRQQMAKAPKAFYMSSAVVFYVVLCFVERNWCVKC